MTAYVAVLALVAVGASAGLHGGSIHPSIISPGGHHSHVNRHYVKVPFVGHKIVKQPVITYVPKVVPVIRVGVKPVHTVTSIREEPLVVFNNRVPHLITGPGISLVGDLGSEFGLSGDFERHSGFGSHGSQSGHGGHGWW